MPFVMLKKNWPGDFRRTVTGGKKGKEYRKTLVFKPGEPVDLSAADLEGVRADIGIALLPVGFDEKARPRPITDDVVPVEIGEESVSSESKSTD